MRPSRRAYLRVRQAFNRPPLPEEQLGLRGPDPFDSRDIRKKIIRTSRPLPDSFSLKPYVTSVRNQGRTNACTGYATACGVEILINRAKAIQGRISLSSQWVYHEARRMARLGLEDNGAYLRDAMKALQKYGVPSIHALPDSHDPTSILDYEGLRRSANFFKIKDYQRIYVTPDLGYHLKSILFNENLPVIAGVRMFNSNLRSPRFKETGLFEMPERGELPNGGHAILIVGYDRNSFIVQNSWGTIWGEFGYGRVSEEYLRKYSLDLWTFTPHYW